VVKKLVFAVPGDLATPTGGYTYDRRIIAELAGLGWQVQVLDLGDGFPRPTADTRVAACAALAALPAGRPLVVDGLAFGALPDTAVALCSSHPLVALVHHPLALETGLSAGDAAALRQSEIAALGCARRVIVTSAATARLLVADYDVPSERLTVVEPGTDRAAAPSRQRGAAVALLAVGAVVPRKGYDVLVAALATLKDLSWCLVIAGDRARDPVAAGRLETDIARFGLADRVSLLGAVHPEQLPALYASTDLFVLPSRFEGYGMAYAEAIAHGVPVVGTSAGATPETVPASAGVLVPPDDVETLAATLRELIGSPQRRQRLALGARTVRFPSWREQGALFARVLETLA
jgi:glycosyltransferase involved in cell wall biosynthesis